MRWPRPHLRWVSHNTHEWNKRKTWRQNSATDKKNIHGVATENASYYAELDERHKELVGETVEVGLMFASKAFVQLLVNPIVGPLTHKYVFPELERILCISEQKDNRFACFTELATAFPCLPVS